MTTKIINSEQEYFDFINEFNNNKTLEIETPKEYPVIGVILNSEQGVHQTIDYFTKDDVFRIWYKDNDKINYVSNIEDLQDLSALNDRIELKFSALKTKPDDNWTGWDSEIFYLRGHLFGLIKSYGIDILKEELNECDKIINIKN